MSRCVCVRVFAQVRSCSTLVLSKSIRQASSYRAHPHRCTQASPHTAFSSCSSSSSLSSSSLVQPVRPLSSHTHGGSNMEDEDDDDLTSSRHDLNFQVGRLQMDNVLRANEQCVRVPEFDGRGGPSPVLKFESNQLRANVPLEDRRCAATCLRTRGMLFGVFDGHGGHACAQAVSERLPYYVATAMMSQAALEDLEVAMETGRPTPPILQWYKHRNDYNYRDSAELYVQHLRVFWQELLASEEHGEGMTPAEAMTFAFQRLDADLSLEAQVPLANELMRSTAVQAAFAGTTACLAHVTADGVLVANAGDCRAVLGVQEEDGSWSAVPLSHDHTALNPLELERVRGQHPPSERDTVVVDERLLGMLMPLRAFGDVRFKWSLELQQSVLESGATCCEMEELLPFQYAPPHYLTPPYLDATPQLTFHRLRPSDRFLILASDGLWDELGSAEAVGLVGRHMTGVHLQEPLSARQRQLSLRQMHQLLLRRRARAAPAPDANAATHLIRHALSTNEYGELDPDKMAAMLALPDDLARMYRDDITVTVIYFNSDLHKHHHGSQHHN